MYLHPWPRNPPAGCLHRCGLEASPRGVTILRLPVSLPNLSFTVRPGDACQTAPLQLLAAQPDKMQPAAKPVCGMDQSLSSTCATAA
nr:hypothetical protein CFP56_33535 [Quercus suber]